jgi:hypothetical protein
MLSQSQQNTILELYAQGVKKREIARLPSFSRLSVCKALRSNFARVPSSVRRRPNPIGNRSWSVGPLSGEPCASP